MALCSVTARNPSNSNMGMGARGAPSPRHTHGVVRRGLGATTAPVYDARGCPGASASQGEAARIHGGSVASASQVVIDK